jgi:hypothetical protein
MTKEHPLETYSSGKAILVHKYVCSLCGCESDFMGITGMSKVWPGEYEMGCQRCLTPWSVHNLIILDEHDHKELGDLFREARKYRRTEKFQLTPEWEADILALEKTLLRPSEQREAK